MARRLLFASSSSGTTNHSIVVMIIFLVLMGLHKQRQIMMEGFVERLSAVVTSAAAKHQQPQPEEHEHANMMRKETTTATSPMIIIKKENYIRACLVVRNANHLLYEWVAYHYTVLPLRYLIVGYDDTNTTHDMPEENPNDVLLRWKQLNMSTDFFYDVWPASDFATDIEYTDGRDSPYFRHLQRQHVFYAKCMQYLHNQSNVGWVALTDIDEYIQLNPLDQHLKETFYNESAPALNDTNVQEGSVFLAPNETLWNRIAARKQLRHLLKLESSNQTVVNQNKDLQGVTSSDTPPPQQPQQPNTNISSTAVLPTVLEFLEEYSSQHGGNASSPCHSFARRRYSAVADDNFTALASSICIPKLDPEIIESMNISHLVTIQFLHHVFPGDIEHNLWAKVLVDLRHIPYQSLQRIIDYNNPHRPLDECRNAYIPDIVSILRANHYINHWNVHVTRRGTNHLGNATTELKKWADVAHIRDYQTCDHIHGWLNDFVKQFGMERAKYLLGYQNHHSQ